MKIKATEENLLDIGFKKVPHFTITNTLTFDLGRNRILSVGDLDNPNCMMYICETDENGKYTDLVNIHNFDFDGILCIHKVQNLIELLNYTGKYRKEYERGS